MDDTRPIKAGYRFADKDRRSAGRVVETTGRVRYGKHEVVVTEAPLTPDVVGRRSFVSESTLRAKYERVSR